MNSEQLQPELKSRGPQPDFLKIKYFPYAGNPLHTNSSTKGSSTYGKESAPMHCKGFEACFSTPSVYVPHSPQLPGLH